MSHNRNRIRQSPASRVLHVINAGILLFLAVIMLYPMWDAVIVSISPAAYASRGGLKLWPAGGISLSAYEYVLSTNSVRIGYRNTIFRTVVGTSISMVMYFMAAYPLSKKVLPLRRFWSLYFLIPMFFSGGLIPEYLLVKSLGLLDNLWAYVLPCLMGTYNLLIVRNFISAIPDSLEESARVDGANFFVILFRIIIPLSLPVLATVALGADGKLLTGADVDCVAALLEGLRVDAIGFNCGFGPDIMLGFVKRLRARTSLPIAVKPNAGLPKVVDGRTVFDVGPEEFAKGVAALVECGATIVGGCCGTTPAFISELRRRVDAL